MKRLWIFCVVALLVIFASGVGFGAERKYCRSGADPFDATPRLEEGEREVLLPKDMLFFNKGKYSLAKCWLKKGDKVTLKTDDDGKEYIDRKTSCNNPLGSPEDKTKKVPWDFPEETKRAEPKPAKPAAPIPPADKKPDPAPASAPVKPSAPAAPVAPVAPAPKPAKPAVSLSANSLRIYKGESVLLTWNSQNAERVFIGDKDMGSIMGSVQTNPIMETITFVATAMAADSQKASTSVTIMAMDVPCSAKKSGWGATIGGVLGSALTIGLIAGDFVTGGAVSLLAPVPLVTTLIGSYLDGGSKCVTPSDVNAGFGYGAGSVALGHVINHPEAGVGPQGERGPQGPQGPQGPPGTTGGGPSIPPPIPSPTGGPVGPPIIP